MPKAQISEQGWSGVRRAPGIDVDKGVIEAVEEEKVGTGQQHRWKMGVRAGRALESQEFVILDHRSGNLVVDRAVVSQDSIGEPPPQVGQVVEGVDHTDTLPDHPADFRGLSLNNERGGC